MYLAGFYKKLVLTTALCNCNLLQSSTLVDNYAYNQTEHVQNHTSPIYSAIPNSNQINQMARAIAASNETYLSDLKTRLRAKRQFDLATSMAIENSNIDQAILESYRTKVIEDKKRIADQILSDYEYAMSLVLKDKQNINQTMIMHWQWLLMQVDLTI